MNKVLKWLLIIILGLNNVYLMYDIINGIILYISKQILLLTIISFGISDLIAFLCILYVIRKLVIK